MRTLPNSRLTSQLASSLRVGDSADLRPICICSATIDTSVYYRAIAREHEWQVFATPLIWYKPNIGHAPWPGYFSRRYEHILFAQRGGRALQRSRADVFEYAAETKKIHAAQKPVDLIKELLSLSFFPGEKVLDPCAGSGTIFRAAKSLNMRATGIELDDQSVGFCKAAIAGD